jgi:hypothetical protein
MPEYIAKVFDRASDPKAILFSSFGESFSAAEAWFGLHACEFDIAILFEGNVVCSQPIDYTHPEDGDADMVYFYHTTRSTSFQPYRVRLNSSDAHVPDNFEKPFDEDEPDDLYVIDCLNIDDSINRTIFVDGFAKVSRSRAFDYRDHLTAISDVGVLILGARCAIDQGERRFANVVMDEVQSRIWNLCGRE